MSNSNDVANAVGAIAEMAWIFYTVHSHKKRRR